MQILKGQPLNPFFYEGWEKTFPDEVGDNAPMCLLTIVQDPHYREDLMDG